MENLNQSIEQQQMQAYDPTADIGGENNDEKIMQQIQMPPPAEECHGQSDVFDSQSQLPPMEFYRQKVNEMHNSGALTSFLQISIATDEFIKSTQKDPLQLLNIYCTVVGEPFFQFYDYELAGCPDKNKFIMVTELDGLPIFGVLQPNKRDAKRACAVRIIDKLMAEERFNCISEKTGRKLKNPSKHPRPLPYSTSAQLKQEMDSLANLGPEYYNQQQQPPLDPQFTEDVDLDKHPKMGENPNANTNPNQYRTNPYANTNMNQQYREDFERQNPVPKDCKDPAQFVQIREHAYRLFCDNAFWDEIKIKDEVLEKLNQCGMWGEQWNASTFVNKCVMRANSWRKAANAAANNGQQQPQIEPAQEEKQKIPPVTVMNQQMAVEEKEKEMQGQPPISFEYFIFTLPFIPARYAALALLDGQCVYGRIADSKSKARLNCANILAAKVVELGWADIEKKPKAPKKKMNVKGKKRKMQESVESMELDETISSPSEYQFNLTIHPLEELDARTHFLLASNPTKNALALLNEILGKQRYDIKYEELTEMNQQNSGHSKFTIAVQLQPPGIPGLPRDLTGGSFCIQGISEPSKKAAKLSAARATLDHFIKTGAISIDQQQCAAFMSSLKKICENYEGQKGEEKQQTAMENLQTGTEGNGTGPTATVE